MSVLYIALPLALALGASALLACVYCIKTGQFDDLDSPAVRMLGDPTESTEKTKSPANTRNKDSEA